ncbi:MAG TPA: hypothetical protein VI320_29840 [Terracidiphilus sp.]|jgi:hypothetical protein
MKTGGLVTVEGLEARMGNGEVSNAGVEQVLVDTGVSFDQGAVGCEALGTVAAAL